MDSPGADSGPRGQEKAGRPRFASAEGATADGAELRIGVLGPLVIVRDGVVLRARPAGERVVLGLLALSEGAPVSQGYLVNTLWSDTPPMSATSIVQTYVSRLRSALGRRTADGEERLSRDGSGYRLELAESEVDLSFFRLLLGDARAARASGNTRRACEAYDQLLSLWYGEPFADVDALRGHSAIVYLMQERTAAIREYAEAASRVGWHARVLPHLRTLASQEPLDESVHALLMIALAGMGRQGEAFSLYEALRLRLDQQLGVYPGPALQDSLARILRQEIVPPMADRDVVTMINSANTDALAERWIGIPARLPICQLPPPVTDFTGRLEESRVLAAVLDPGDGPMGVPIVVISGAPGVGKTALAVHLAHIIRGAFPDGQLYVQMAGNSQCPRDPTDALGGLLRALGVDGQSVPDSLGERTGLFRSLTAGRKLLVTVDDAATAEQVRSMLPSTPGSAVIVTARSRLGTLAGARLLHLDPLPPEDATEMLCRIVGRERVAAEPAASETLISVCGRLPLALRIVAAKLATRPTWSVSVVTKAVADERRRLDELAVDDLAIRASISPSYEALDQRERRAFRRLGLLEATEFAEWVIAALIGEPDASEAVGVLVDKSLLTPIGADGTEEPRYELHDLLRDYVVEKLDDEPEDDRAAALARALTGWLEIAAFANHRLPRVPAILRPGLGTLNVLPEALVRRVTTDPVAWFNAERLNLAAATRQACAIGLYKLASQLAAHQSTFQFFQARLDDAEQLWRLVISAAETAGDATAAARAELWFAPMLAERGKNAEAMGRLNHCLRVFEALGDEQALSLALHLRAYCAEQQNLLHNARDYATRGLEIARRIGNSYMEMSNLRILGVAATRLGDIDSGVRMCEEALALARQLQEPYAEFETMQTLAYACSLAQRHVATVDLCQQGVEMAHKLDYPAGEAYMLGPLGDAYFALGRYDDAFDALSKAQKIFQTRGLVRANAICLLKLALTDQALGRYKQAVLKLKASLPVFRDLQLSGYEDRALAALEECCNVSEVRRAVATDSTCPNASF
jgi:DNA-binding SARP family transcriptional activator